MTSISLPSQFSGRIALSIDETAGILGMCRVAIYGLINGGKLPAFKGWSPHAYPR